MRRVVCTFSGTSLAGAIGANTCSTTDATYQTETKVGFRIFKNASFPSNKIDKLEMCH